MKISEIDKIKKVFGNLPRWQKNIIKEYAPGVSFDLKGLSEDNNLPNGVIKECKKNSKILRNEEDINNVIYINFKRELK